MKIGDTYISNGWKFEVIGFDGENRIVSKRLGKADFLDTFGLPFTDVEDTKLTEFEEEEPEEKPEEKEKQFTKTDINRMSVVDLTALSKEMGINVGTGAEMKKEIIAKLGL